MTQHIFKEARRFPKVHLALAGAFMTFTALALTLLPSSEVEATRSRIELIKPVESKTVKLEAPAPATPAAEANLSSEPESQVQPEPETEQALTSVPDSTPEPVAKAINWVDYTIRSGDNLTKVFKRAGLNARDVHAVSEADKEHKYLNRLRPGQTLSVAMDQDQLERVRIAVTRLESIEFVRADTGFQAEKLVRTPEVRLHFVTGDIQSSLFLAAQRAGLSEKTTMELAEIFGWDIDFALDIRRGDQFRVLFEEHYLDDEKIGDGLILAAEFTNNGDTFAAVRYTDSDGASNYYTPEGRSMRKAFLRSPVDFRRISSNFNPERYHPVLGVKRPHRGTDYAAATGTPIKAAGDGKVIWRGTKGGYGRTVIIQHGNDITTLYAHMSKYQSNVTNGSRVKQGQTIGYVGKSGTATGPHLHYEFRVSGVHKNPVTVKLPDAQPIAKKELTRFKAETGQLIAELQQRAAEQVALLADASPNG